MIEVEFFKLQFVSGSAVWSWDLECAVCFSQRANPTAAPFGASVWREAGGFTTILSPLAQFLSCSRDAVLMQGKELSNNCL